MRKRLAILTAALWFALLAAVPVLAGEWKQDPAGWWWQDDDGTWPADEWRWLDGNRDGIAECYYFGSDGYLLTGTETPDHYFVNDGGAWVEDGTVQTKAVPVTGSPAGPQLSSVLAPLPDFNAPVTEENVLAVLDNLDPDGARIIRDAASSPAASYNPLLGWWNAGTGRLMDQMSAAVHEECHLASLVDGTYSQTRYYTGGGTYETVSLTPVFDSQEMIGDIPQELRTFRFDTYLGRDAQANLVSRSEGVYGMLNEFTAYCWGTNDEMKTYEYCRRNGLNGWSNSGVAHAEFRYYILRYMLYAREHHPDVYEGILNNAAFRRAFTAVDTRFGQIMQEFMGKLPRYAVSFLRADYDMLMNEMAKPEYQEMLELLKP